MSKIDDKIYDEAYAFPLTRFVKSDGSINIRKLKGLHKDFYQDALNLIFIRRSLDVHGKFFGYSEVDYKSSRQFVKIYCPDHDGYFNQLPTSHLQGHGCPQCAKKFIERETEVGKFTVPCPFHKYLVDETSITWYNKFNELRIDL